MSSQFGFGDPAPGENYLEVSAEQYASGRNDPADVVSAMRHEIGEEESPRLPRELECCEKVSL